MKRAWKWMMAVALLAGSVSYGANLAYVSSTDSNWFTVANWKIENSGGAPAGSLPTSGDEVRVLDGWAQQGLTVPSPGAVSSQLRMGIWGSGAKVTVEPAGTLSVSSVAMNSPEAAKPVELINQGDFTSSGPLYIKTGVTSVSNSGTFACGGMNPGDPGMISFTAYNSGDMDITAGWLYLATATGTNCTFNMMGGTLDVADKIAMAAGGSGRLNLYGGTVTAGNMDIVTDGSYTIDVREGTLTVDGDKTAGLNTMKDRWYLTAYGGTGTVVIAYDEGNNETTVSALSTMTNPPPQTLAYVSTTESNWFRASSWQINVQGGDPAGRIPTSSDTVRVLSNWATKGLYVSRPGAVCGGQMELGKWSSGGMLTVEETGTLSLGGVATRSPNDATPVDLINHGEFSASGVIYVNNGRTSITNTGTFACGGLNPGDAAMTSFTVQNTGIMNINAGWLYLATGTGTNCTWNMLDGEINVANNIAMGDGGSARLNLYGGTITTPQIGLLADGNYIIDITGDGTMVVGTNQVAGLNHFKDLGYLISSDGGAVVIQLDESSNTVVSAAYEYSGWANSWGVDIGSETNDYDGDAVDNLGEYGLNGDPTDPADKGQTSTAVDGTDLIYVHAQRSTDPDLSYWLETTDDLLNPSWTNTGYSVVGTNVTGQAYDDVTNSVPTDADQTFIRLRIQKN